MAERASGVRITRPSSLFSALRALASEGIQRGHMGLHARNVAIAAGATGPEIERVAKEMIAQGTIREDAARALINNDPGM